MKIEAIRLKNYKVFKSVDLENLPSMVVFVGANGTGKSTIFDVLGFLRDALKNNVRQALQKRGGYKEVVSRGAPSGARGDIIVELQFRLEISGRERLVTYHLRIRQKKNQPVIVREILRYKRGAVWIPLPFS